jgi:hypothetical protein
VPVSAVMFPEEKSKYSGGTKPELLKPFFHLNKTFDNLPELNETTFSQPFTVFVSLGQFANKFKKNFENLTLDIAK